LDVYVFEKGGGYLSLGMPENALVGKLETLQKRMGLKQKPETLLRGK